MVNQEDLFLTYKSHSAHERLEENGRIDNTYLKNAQSKLKSLSWTLKFIDVSFQYTSTKEEQLFNGGLLIHGGIIIKNTNKT
jgi:hypothetical protein